MGKISATTHEFRIKVESDDNKCLYWSFLSVMKPFFKDILGDVPFTKDLKGVLNAGLRMLVADYICRHEELRKQTEVFCKIIQAYLYTVEQGMLWGGQIELRALSDLYNVAICVINPKKIINGNCLSPWNYGQDNPLVKKCVYIFYNGKDHFNSIYLMNKKNANEIETMFDLNDPIVHELLREFIRNKLHHYGAVELGFQISTRVEETHPMEDLSQSEAVYDSIAYPNKSIKRKESGADAIPMASKNDRHLPIPIPEEFYDQNKRAKFAEDADQSSMPRKNNAENMDIKAFIEAGISFDEFDIQVDQTETTYLPIASNDEHKEEEAEMKDEPGNKPGDSI